MKKAKAKKAAPGWKPLPGRAKVLVAVLTYSKQVGAEVFGWCCKAIPEMQDHPRVEAVAVGTTFGYPTDRMRNAVCKQALAQGYDFLLMLDDDMVPDCRLGHDPDAKPFLPTALEYACQQTGPVVVGAP